MFSVGGNDKTLLVWDTDLVDLECFDPKYDEEADDDIRQYKFDVSKALKREQVENQRIEENKKKNSNYEESKSGDSSQIKIHE